MVENLEWSKTCNDRKVVNLKQVKCAMFKNVEGSLEWPKHTRLVRLKWMKCTMVEHFLNNRKLWMVKSLLLSSRLGEITKAFDESYKLAGRKLNRVANSRGRKIESFVDSVVVSSSTSQIIAVVYSRDREVGIKLAYCTRS